MRSKTGIKAAAILATSALLLTACSGGGGTTEGDNDAGGGGGNVELTFWSWAPNMDKVVKIWNDENPDIQVTVAKQDGGDPAITKLLTAVKAGSGAPDVMQAEYQKIPTLVSADALVDISEYLDGDLASEFPEGVWNSVTLGSDAVYAVPQDSGPMLFFYRADIFEDLGIEVPVTWDDYAEAARQVRAADTTMYLGTFSASDAGWFTGLAQQAGASWWGIDGDAWSVTIDDTPTQKVAEYWGGLVEEGAINNKPMYTPEWNAALNNGTEIGWLSAVWAPGVLEGNAADTVGNWKVAPMPQWDPENPATGNWGGSATAVINQSEHPAEAAEFSAWLNSSQDAVNALVQESGVYPANTPAQEEALTSPPKFFADQEDFYDIAGAAAQTAGNFTYGPNVNVAFSAYNDEFGKATEAKSQAEFVEAVTSMQKVTLDDLKNSGFNVTE